MSENSLAPGSPLIFVDINEDDICMRHEWSKDFDFRTSLGADPEVYDAMPYEEFAGILRAEKKLLRKSIRLKSSPDIPIGAFSFRQPTTSHQRALYFGFFIYPPYQNKGYGKQAMRYLLDLAFEMDGKKWMAVQSGVMGWNDRGVAFFKGIGFTASCLERNQYLFQGRLYPGIFVDMTRADYEQMKGNDHGLGKSETE